ncbi:NRDE family protein [Yeosuana sp. AK3]
MCTVTIIPKGNHDFILTSNRDEAPHRASLIPQINTINNIRLLFPKDELSGGTWIGVSEKKSMVCVLNGAFELHKRKPSYRLSRGVVATDFLTSEDILSTVKSYNLDNIEPFTMVIVDWKIRLRFFELVWDGEKKHELELPLEPNIWSSSTLYNSSMKLERLKWFEDFKKSNELNNETILQFHKTAGNEHKDYGVIMDRGFVKTTSITQVIKASDSIHMIHENLQTELVTSTPFKFHQTVNE